LEKHTSYYNLLEQLKDRACPVCEQARKSVQSFLDTYLYEGVNDDTNWNRLSAAGGWCARHAGQMEAFSDGLAVALFYRHEIRKRIQELGAKKEGGWFSKKELKPPCPACVTQAEIEASQAHLLARAFEEPEFKAALEAHPGLCLPHAEAVLRQLKGAPAEAFKALSATQLEALCAELDEIVKKSDYRNLEKMGSEGDSWRRALARVYGPHYAP
jgi:hypothetical protein